jgi:hypothetical protein
MSLEMHQPIQRLGQLGHRFHRPVTASACARTLQWQPLQSDLRRCAKKAREGAADRQLVSVEIGKSDSQLHLIGFTIIDASDAIAPLKRH